MVKVSEILEDLNLTYTNVGKNHIVSCWYHEEKKPSMAIHKETGVFHCFSCKRSGNLFGIINQHLGLKGIELLQYLSDFYDVREDEAEVRVRSFKEDVLGPRNQSEVLHRQIVEMPKYVPCRFHSYLANRGITTEEIQKWNMGIVDYVQPIEKFKGYGGWILIPIYQNRILRNYFMRSPFSNKKIYGSYSMKDIVFGYDEAADFSQPLYIVEGIFDMIALKRTGVQVIASLTNRLYEEKYKLLKQYSKIIIVPDSDTPGFRLVQDALPYLKDMPIGVCQIPNGKKDTGECTLKELDQVINSERDIIDCMAEMHYVTKFKRNNKGGYRNLWN